MFTGIIEQLGRVENIEVQGTNVLFRISSPISKELKIDQSIAHDGVCLTVVKQDSSCHEVVAIQETLQRTTLNQWKVGDKINLERCMQANGRFDGHVVQGHVDGTGKCLSVEDLDGSFKFWFEYDKEQTGLIIEKGSITINGTSLTVVDDELGKFSVCIIPYTYEHTNFNQIQQGTRVNLEFDVIGKYVKKLLNK